MLQIDFINVGYGDSILVRDTEASFSMLVDMVVGKKRVSGFTHKQEDARRRSDRTFAQISDETGARV